MLGEEYWNLLSTRRSCICKPWIRTHGLKQHLTMKQNIENWDCPPSVLIYHTVLFSSHLLNVWLPSAEEHGHLVKLCVYTWKRRQVPQGPAGCQINQPRNKHRLLSTAGQTRTRLCHTLFDIIHFIIPVAPLQMCRENKNQNPKNLLRIHGTHLSGFREA